MLRAGAGGGPLLALAELCAVGTVCAARPPAPRSARPKEKADPALRGLLLLALLVAGAAGACEEVGGAALVSVAAMGAASRSLVGGVGGACASASRSISARKETTKHLSLQ